MIGGESPGGPRPRLPDPIGEALDWIVGGGLLAYPTETVWGLGVDAASTPALARLVTWKGRGADSPVSVLVESVAAARAAGFALGAAAARLAERFWPGPLTLVVPGPGGLAPGVARADGAVGLRCSSHPLAHLLARRLQREHGRLLTSTSLNHSGDPAARSVDEARALCGEGLAEPRLVAVEGAEAGGEAASTVVDASGSAPRVLRWGAIRAAELEPLLQELT
jgi:tRNA threonylcarbamoyl adenosine modification protein (Sua5/YciO/YrdC/YwlC family)